MLFSVSDLQFQKALTVAIYSVGHISCGHFKPAVTIALAAVRKVQLKLLMCATLTTLTLKVLYHDKVDIGVMLASALFDCNGKDDLVKKQTKAAQEAVAGLKKAQAEVLYMKQDMDKVCSSEQFMEKEWPIWMEVSMTYYIIMLSEHEGKRGRGETQNSGNRMVEKSRKSSAWDQILLDMSERSLKTVLRKSKYGLASGIITKNLDTVNTMSRSTCADIVSMSYYIA
ncbi:hypothetical protein VNO77_04569 [Canavalia gladiata]|uniref:Uncharacterized protein n=1 Tax=Canavalia gladiata TaxID=3824 RepID=A0AAN9MWQ9_CANGL